MKKASEIINDWFPDLDKPEKKTTPKSAAEIVFDRYFRGHPRKIAALEKHRREEEARRKRRERYYRRHQMKYPEFDANGYPTERTLCAIRKWPYTDLKNLLAFIRAANWEEYGTWRQRGSKIVLTTGGWSGNESLIGALAQNLVVWGMCWWSSERGGYHVLDIPEYLMEKKANESP